jgi:hypothetical protein
MSLSDERKNNIFYCPKAQNFFYSYRDVLFVCGHYYPHQFHNQALVRVESIGPTNWNFKYKLFWLPLDGTAETHPYRDNKKTERRFPLCTLNDLPEKIKELWEDMIGSDAEKSWVQHLDAIEKKYWKEFNTRAEAEAERFHAERGTKIESDTEDEEGTA